MTALPDEDRMVAAMEATWPAAAQRKVGPFVVRQGLGGGKRVSAATVSGAFSAGDIDAAAGALRELDQPPLFMLRNRDAELDAALEGKGYQMVDAVELYAASVADLGAAPGDLDVFPHWPPLSIATSLWAEGRIGPARIAVMHRVDRPHVVLLARLKDRSAGVGFVAVDGDLVMLHALEVSPAARRLGVGGMLLRAAAAWGAEQGASMLGLAVASANAPARALYASHGMRVVGGYHYRQG